jgi:hypothetical protein
MIWDVDESVRAWLSRYLPAGVPVVFDPVERCESARGELLSAFLYDIEDDPTGGTATWQDFRDAAGQVIGRRPPGRRYRFTYLLTACGPDGAREHQLLGAVLAGCSGSGVLPPDCAVGVVAQAEQSIIVRSAPEISASWVHRDMPSRTAFRLQLLVPYLPEVQMDLEPAPRELLLGSDSFEGGMQARRTRRFGGISAGG